MGFLKKGFFQSWDRRVFDSYMRFGLKEKTAGRVALTMDKIDEAVRPGYAKYKGSD